MDTRTNMNTGTRRIFI